MSPSNQPERKRPTLIERLRQEWAEEFGDSTGVYFSISRPEKRHPADRVITSVYPKYYDPGIPKAKLEGFAIKINNSGLNIIFPK